jgi:PAS domain S-box-containing protein
MEMPLTQSTTICQPEDLIDLFESAPEMLAILSIDGEFLRVNAASQHTIGRVSESLIGTSLLELVYPDDLHAVAQKFVRISQTGAKGTFRSRCPGVDGRLRWIQWDLKRASTDRQIYAIARDVTDHCTAEKELARANEILSTVLLTAPLPIWASDPEGRIQFWNESAEKVLGWSSGEIFNGTAPDLLPACGGSNAKSPLAGEKMSWRRKDGSTRQLRFWTAPLHENGVQCGTLGMTVDVTEYDAEVYEALERAYNDLRDTRDAVMEYERLRVLGQMASGIAHDINNALSPVKLYVQLLIEDERALTEEGRRNLRTIQSAVEDIAQTVARIREFYRSREPQLALAPVKLNELVHQVVDLTRPRWRDIPQQMGLMIEIATDLGDNLPPVLGIESEIREALTNLVFNAVDAMPAGGVLSFRTGIVREHAVDGLSEVRHAYVEVGDTGLGMDEDTCRRCLEPFFTTKGDRGTGLGLAMVYGAMQRNGGALEIQSALGKGTTMRLRFEVSVSGDAPSEHAVVSGPACSPMRILVIDDDVLVAQALRATLERDGHHVTTANSGEAGVSTFRVARNQGEEFHLVLTDLGMPYMDGRRVASVVKAESPSTPVVLLTGWGRRIAAENDVPPHVDRLLSKPPDLNALRDVIASCAGIEVEQSSRRPIGTSI